MTAGCKVYYRVYDGWQTGTFMGFHPFIPLLAMIKLHEGGCKYIPVIELENLE